MSHPRDEEIGAALAAVSSTLTPAGNSGWQFAPRDCAHHVVNANIADDWLMFDADYSDAAQSTEHFWEILVRNGSLAGPAKLVLASDGSLRIRAELPVLEGLDLTSRVRETCRGFAAAWARQNPPSFRDAPLAGEAEPIDLKVLCAEAGWPFAERGGRKLAVELEVPGGFCQALLIPEEQGVRIRCEVATVDGITEECQQAIGGLLLAASGWVRLCRASVDTSEISSVARFEVCFGSAPSSLEISSALECLSVACSYCGEEIKTLQAPAIAERYLALRGWGSLRAASETKGQ